VERGVKIFLLLSTHWNDKRREGKRGGREGDIYIIFFNYEQCNQI